MSGFIIGLALGELVSLIIVALLSKGEALEALGISSILWAGAWFITTVVLAGLYFSEGWLGRGPVVALGVAFVNLAAFHLAKWVDTKYGNPAN
ncbi:MAG: hypothetical protein WAT12_11125 [Candidatus Nitrotoga sp.]|nr:MAG: hypothetical protein IPM09_01190 [Candidatus Saccharibacteria bacterium]